MKVTAKIKSSPKLRSKLARILHKALRQFEVEECPETFDLAVHIDQIIALIPDEEEQPNDGVCQPCLLSGLPLVSHELIPTEHK